VVDNHPASGLTPPVVHAIGDPRIRLAEAPRPGLARARNVGLLAARHDVVAFTDDDVIVDRHWLTGIATGFSRHPGVGCVTGLVPTAELNSLAQAYFDGRVAWSRLAPPDVFTLTDDRPDEPMFPFEVARFGTGANFALRRELALVLGGFDEGLGVGSPTGGAEDIDMFLRVVLARRSLAFEPSAMIWHRHRPDLDRLALQVRDYGTGLGAFLAKYAVRPRSASMMLRRAAPGLRHARRITKVELPGHELPLDFAALSAAELRGMLAGPLLLARARREGRRARPLLGRSLRPGSTAADTTAGAAA
jgi:glycosyltransferase involved in cell wall biosynthesis